MRVHKRRSRSRTGSTERLLKLTTEQKCDIAQREHDELREEINKFKHETEKILDTYRVSKLKNTCLTKILFVVNRGR